MKNLILLLIIFSFGLQLTAQEQPSPIIYIYDASGSMWGQIEGKTKMEIAAAVLTQSVESFAKDQRIGLVAYGHRQKGDCRDVETLLSMQNTSKSALASSIQSIKPLGKTPLAYSAELVIDQLRASKQKATIVLITDGIESCDGDICEVVTQAKAEGIDFKLHIVGFGLKEIETKQLECAAKAGDGNYYDAADAGGLGDALYEATNQTIDKPQGNLGVCVIKDGKPLDADVEALVTGTEKQIDFGRTYKDTAFLYLPSGTYDLKVWQHGFNAISPLVVKGVKTVDDKITYKTIALDGAKIKVLVQNNGAFWDSQISINTPDGKQVVGGRTYAKAKTFELDPGIYNITVEARNMHGLEKKHTIENVSVGNGEVTEAAHNFQSGIAVLGATYQGQPFDANITITEVGSGEKVYGFRTRNRNLELTLNPGKYEVNFTEAGVYNSSAKSAKFTIEVKAGESITKTAEVK